MAAVAVAARRGGGRPAQDAVRAEFPEVSKLLMDSGGKVYQEGNVRPRARARSSLSPPKPTSTAL